MAQQFKRYFVTVVRGWHPPGFDVSVPINTSAAQYIRQMLHRRGFDPELFSWIRVK